MGELVVLTLLAAMVGVSCWAGKYLGEAVAPDVNRAVVRVMAAVDRLRGSYRA